MAFKITEEKEYQDIPLVGIYCRIHIQVTVTGQIIAKPLFYTSKESYKKGSKPFKSWYAELTRKQQIPVPVEDGKNGPKKTKYQEVEVKEKKDLCLMYLKFKQVEEYKNLIKEVQAEVIDTLLEVGFISSKKDIKID